MEKSSYFEDVLAKVNLCYCSSSNESQIDHILSEITQVLYISIGILGSFIFSKIYNYFRTSKLDLKKRELNSNLKTFGTCTDQSLFDFYLQTNSNNNNVIDNEFYQLNPNIQKQDQCVGTISDSIMMVDENERMKIIEENLTLKEVIENLKEELVTSELNNNRYQRVLAGLQERMDQFEKLYNSIVEDNNINQNNKNHDDMNTLDFSVTSIAKDDDDGKSIASTSATMNTIDMHMSAENFRRNFQKHKRPLRTLSVNNESKKWNAIDAQPFSTSSFSTGKSSSGSNNYSFRLLTAHRSKHNQIISTIDDDQYDDTFRNMENPIDNNYYITSLDDEIELKNRTILGPTNENNFMSNHNLESRFRSKKKFITSKDSVVSLCDDL
ncbi:hypothetical protein SNEBB_006574 [Seison nebaliae]|nr:hypothetical protein SNEBB_006574 [Seison nebaliae]